MPSFLLYSPTRATIRFTEGTTYRKGFEIRDQEGSLVNLNGATLIFLAYQRTAPGHAASPFMTKTVPNGGIVLIDALLGSGMVCFTPGDTTNLKGNFDWELQLTEFNGDVWTPGMGVLVVEPARRYGQ